MNRTRNSIAGSHCFLLLAGLILAVSLYDTFLIIKFSDTMQQMEENPVGRWLIGCAAGHVGVFVRVKLAGTFIVLLTLTLIRRFQRKRSMPITVSVASFQAGLFTYLTFV